MYKQLNIEVAEGLGHGDMLCSWKLSVQQESSAGPSAY